MKIVRVKVKMCKRAPYAPRLCAPLCTPCVRYRTDGNPVPCDDSKSRPDSSCSPVNRMEYLTKPIKIHDFMQTLDEALKHAKTAAAASKNQEKVPVAPVSSA